MPAVFSSQFCSFDPAPAKKRKRDPQLDQAISLSRSASLSSFSRTNQPHRLEYSIPKESNNDYVSCYRCPPRKRRASQQIYPNQYQQQNQSQSLADRQSPTSNTVLLRSLTPNTCAPISQDTASPPISPKTLVPVSYPLQPLFTSASCLRPCHICHRRPTTREVLDAYDDCDLCGQRSCYICLRQCDSLNCRGSANFESRQLKGSSPDGAGVGARYSRRICSYCAIEGSTESGMEVVRCLDCARAELSPYQA